MQIATIATDSEADEVGKEELRATAEHLTLVVHALVIRLGGEVVLTGEELFAASCRKPTWAPFGADLVIKLGGPWQSA